MKVKIKKDNLYILPSSDLVRVVREDYKADRVIVHNYHSRQNDFYSYEIAEKVFIPVWKIGEVSKMFGKKPATLRKYENLGLIHEARKVQLGKKEIRIYTESDIMDLVEFFATRRGVGRPSLTNVGGVNRKEIERIISLRKEIHG